jgi:CDP-glycerol glycerophosphotransferase (TagB/SpsB family)
MLHVHVNHGESDKLSSSSNQVKAYDRVLVAGPAAVRRYRRGLLGFDHSKVVAVGRPQLDLRFTPELEVTSRRTVIYAPTWEGDVEANNWTSVDRLGPQIVAGLLEVARFRVVYKPHPLVARSNDPAMLAAHRRILSLMQDADLSDPAAGHLAVEEGNLLAMFDACDALIGDVSSVPLDFLYLRPDAPILLTDRRADRAALIASAPLAAAVPVIDAGTVTEVPRLLAEALTLDAYHTDRRRVRADYFGDLGPGDSTRVFTATMSGLVCERDRLLDLRPPELVQQSCALLAGEAEIDLGAVG